MKKHFVFFLAFVLLAISTVKSQNPELRKKIARIIQLGMLENLEPKQIGEKISSMLAGDSVSRKTIKLSYKTKEKLKLMLSKITKKIKDFSRRNWKEATNTYYSYMEIKEYIKARSPKSGFYVFIILPIIVGTTSCIINTYKTISFFS